MVREEAARACERVARPRPGNKGGDREAKEEGSFACNSEAAAAQQEAKASATSVGAAFAVAVEWDGGVSHIHYAGACGRFNLERVEPQGPEEALRTRPPARGSPLAPLDPPSCCPLPNP